MLKNCDGAKGDYRVIGGKLRKDMFLPLYKGQNKTGG